jgi:hypothetical protein
MSDEPEDGGKEEPENEKEAKDAAKADSEIGAASGSPAGTMKKLRKIILVIALITFVIGGIMIFSEDLIPSIQSSLQSLIQSLTGAAGPADATVKFIVASNGSVKAFVDNNTGASMHISYFRKAEASRIFQQMRSDCGLANQSGQSVEEVYRVTVGEDNVNRSLVAWVDWINREILCLAKKGDWVSLCKNHSYSLCYDDDLYWYDGCNERQGVRQSCYGICKNNSCSQSCVYLNQAATPADNIECCEGLTKIDNSSLNGSDCIYPVNESFVCTNCGDGLCQSPENICNCPIDCDFNCTDNDGRNYRTQGKVERDGVRKYDKCKSSKSVIEYYCEHKAIMNETYECPEKYECSFGKCIYVSFPCLEGGEVGLQEPGYECCNNFTASSQVRDEETGGCKTNYLTFVCIQCGNGICGLGETTCNCASDCP